MIKTQDAVASARALLGTPYEEMDCIALIRAVIRRSAGGEKGYRCEGTNWLWRSTQNSGKYRHLTWRQESMQGARAGMLAFKRNGEDIHHVGLVTQEGTVIHSSSVSGCVMETTLDGSWQCLGQHRCIEVAGQEINKAVQPSDADTAYERITIVDAMGNRFEPVGDFRVLRGSCD